MTLYALVLDDSKKRGDRNDYHSYIRSLVSRFQTLVVKAVKTFPEKMDLNKKSLSLNLNVVQLLLVLVALP